MAGRIEIGGHEIGGGAPGYLIAEVAQAHDGSLGMAHAFIDAAASAGADAIKFQTHLAEAESTRDEPFRVPFSRQDASRYEYWQRTSFSAEQWAGLAGHAGERGLAFLSSPFSIEAVELLRKLDVPAWKVASGEVASRSLLAAICRDAKPVLLSTGMSTFAEIDSAVATIQQAATPLAVLQCASLYPTPLEAVGLNVLHDYRARYGCPVGLSDHSGCVHPALAALAQGADIVEVHLTLSRHMFGPDVPVSLTVDELKAVAAARDAFHTMAAHAVDKDAAAGELSEMRAMFGRSLAPRTDLPAGTVIGADMLTAKKPATGIPADAIETVIGKQLIHAVSADRLLTWEDIDVPA
ncbi:MAG: N-acetylneuraminate synthase family protein [Alphaproteobacteria bacterium]|nr:N-acetylneuraminate synthase family protein [Alphaproteobacteria bacterium]